MSVGEKMDHSMRNNWLVIWVEIKPISTLLLYKNKIASGPNMQILKMKIEKP